MSEAPALNAALLMERMTRGELPRDFMMFAAQGLLPLPQDDLVAVLAFLTTLDDAELASSARASLSEMIPRVVAAFCSSALATAPLLDALAAAVQDGMVLEAIVRSRAVSDETFERLARTAQPGIQEIIVTNQERIIRSPAILDALLENPSITPDVRRRVMETREEFFDKQARRALAAELIEGLDIENDLDLDPIADLLEKAETEPQPEDTLPPMEAATASPDNFSVFTKISNMNVAERVQAAYKGGKSERTILVRDRNRLVCTAVVRSPRITETEIEAYAAMRNVEDEVLRIIGTKREYQSKYAIVHNLVKNPKTPAGIALNLVGRLTSKDLKFLSTSKDVSEIIRSHARKLMQAKAKH
ncbi:MAG: hypothetical protein ACSLFQ_00235 [Thermoanaerobaculia bacterium]